MRNFCASIGPNQAPDKVVYISTSGVYGDCGGAWVTEETAVKVALLRNASVRASYERLGVARADLLQAGLVARGSTVMG